MAPQRNTGAGAEAELPEYAGHYRLESCLGSGGMGVVHLARSTSGLKLAVKVVHAEFAKDPEFRGRFRQEVAAARRVSGAFTAPVVDADPEAARPWMATLFIPGPTLSDHVKQNGPMAPAQLRRLMAGLAEALRDIHRVGVVHRDLKPSNVLLAEDGPKVIDFGISRPKDSELRTETGKLIGTPPFMAPEQFRRPREVGPAADIFALGSVLVHAATGRGPFDSDSPYVVAYQVVHDEPDLTGVPEGLAPLVLGCLAKEPEDRPTPDELMRELRSVAASYDTQAFIPSQRGDDTQSGTSGDRSNGTPGDTPDDVPGDTTSDTPSGAPPPESRAGKPGRRPRSLLGRMALVAGAFSLVVGGAWTVVRLLDDGGPTPDGPRTTLAAFRTWEAKPASGDSAVPQCSYGADKLLCGGSGLVFALDPFDGSVVWRHRDAPAVRSGPPVLSGGLVQPLPARIQRLEALDPGSGRTRWHRHTPAYTAMRQAGGMLLLTGADGTVTGVNSASGKTEWSHRIPGQSMPYFTSFAGDPLAYAVSTSDDGSGTRVTAVDAETGDVRWDARMKGNLTPFGSENGSVFLLSEDPVYGRSQAVVRYTPASRSTRTVALPLPLDGAHATVHGSAVYLLAAGGALEAVDMDRHRQLWHVETSVSRGSAPVADGGHVYFTSADGRLLAFDAGDGRLLGQTRPRLGTHADRVPAALPEPVIVDGHVYAGAPDGTVFGVDGRDPSLW
ncbi:serine/threonine-protein kinase [Streptomyces gibsoniae]|uniref:Serine/threonine-protein kinase n=1 Tax=Streptomyces gibsoniae TaxID=3075529 RepID=A0ABU2TS78_9ACTN|nr:serine/threonine-protein kinase [Streptomyces sp. DSM 41699]MDT0463807.1 serine/threonine-protein kinase [Streptomyces sp. DSM 41699]